MSVTVGTALAVFELESFHLVLTPVFPGTELFVCENFQPGDFCPCPNVGCSKKVKYGKKGRSLAKHIRYCKKKVRCKHCGKRFEARSHRVASLFPSARMHVQHTLSIGKISLCTPCVQRMSPRCTDRAQGAARIPLQTRWTYWNDYGSTFMRGQERKASGGSARRSA